MKSGFQSAFMGFFWPKYRVYLKNESLSLKMTLVGLNESPKSHGILETKQNCWPK